LLGKGKDSKQTFPFFGTLATYSKKNEKEHIIIQMNLQNKTAEGCNVIYDDAIKLHEYAFKNHEILSK